MSLPPSALVPESLPVVAAAVLLPLVLGSLVYLDARRRRGRASQSASLAPLAWSAAVVCSGVGAPVVVACYAVVRGR